MTSPTPARRKPARRPTQSERSASTQRAVLDATLGCMRRHGLANTTLQQIEKAARMTRGALLYHFPTKRALFAATLVHFYRLRIERLQMLVKARKPDLRAGLVIMHEEVRDWFPVTLEFMNAMRTDAALRKSFDQEMGRWIGSISENYVSLLPGLADTQSPLLVQYVIGCFLRGLCLESFVSEPALVKEIFERFTDILETYLRSPPIAITARRSA
ncbi:MAG: TetR/AcrR family transcriptional regulator [Steroidobacteraceae bacterium]